MKLIILDRDGVLNQDSDQYIKSADEWLALPGSMEAVGKLTQAGFTLAVATNQSGLARGYFTLADLQAMHEKMTKLAAQHGGRFAHIAYCPHGPDDSCQCRKPLPGLIHEIETTLNLSAQGAWVVGDSIRDLEAGNQAGCKTALVRTGKGRQSEKKLTAAQLNQTLVFDDLASFADYIINNQ
ncbi:MAG: D-glycero-beta-D-manno-heptose 1,7-bisphosphate 7-phosphatase [Venatoribacter sp.]